MVLGSESLQSLTTSEPLTITSQLAVTNGLTLANGATLTLSGGSLAFNGAGSQTLGGTGKVLLGDANNATGSIFAQINSTLTIGPNITVIGNGYIENEINFGNTCDLINQGTINATGGITLV